MAETIRTFIAVELDEKARELIRDVQTRLKSAGADVKWVKPENAHLTLKFLGDVPEKRLKVVIETLEKLTASASSIQTRLTQLGMFPDRRRPRVIWVGLDDAEGRLTRLAEAVETALGNIGFKKEDRAFQPHITIARLRSSHNAGALAEAAAQFSIPCGINQSFASLTLFKSTLTPAGPVYEPLKKFFMTPVPPSAPQPA